MKKEKTVKAHTRRTKSGRTVQVKQHSAKYDSADDMAKKALQSKKGAGEELNKRKNINDIEEFLNSFPKEHQKALKASISEMLDNMEAQGASNKKLARLIHEDGKSVSYLRKSHNKFAKEYGLPKVGAVGKKNISPISQEDFKAWYNWDGSRGKGNEAALRAEKTMKDQMGAKEYRKFYNNVADNWTSRGANKFYKQLPKSETSGTEKSKKSPELLTTEERETKKMVERKHGK